MELVAYRKITKAVNYTCPHCGQVQESVQEFICTDLKEARFVVPVCCEDLSLKILN